MSDHWQTSLDEFEGPKTLEQVYADVDSCTQCSIKQMKVNQGRSKVRGMEERSPLLFIGQNPSIWRKGDRDLYESKSGKLLSDLLNQVGLDRETIFVTNVVKCSTVDNKRPKLETVKNCMPFLLAEIRDLDPKLIVAVGSLAASVLNAKIGQFTTFRGYRTFAIYHPAFLLRREEDELVQKQYRMNLEIIAQEVSGWT